MPSIGSKYCNLIIEIDMNIAPETTIFHARSIQEMMLEKRFSILQTNGDDGLLISSWKTQSENGFIMWTINKEIVILAIGKAIRSITLRV